MGTNIGAGCRVGACIVVALLSLATLPAARQSSSLRVISASPVGELGHIADGEQIRIIFSEPMVPIGTIPSGAAPAWIRISPAVPGSFYWSGTKTLIFSPDDRATLPYATRFIVRIDASASSAAGVVLGTPYEFTFTTPTVRLISTEWQRKTDRFDSPVMLALRFNQRVAPEVVFAHTRVALTPHTWTPSPLTDAARRYLGKTDPAGLRRFDEKVEAVRRAASAANGLSVRLAQSWDQNWVRSSPDLVVLETIDVPPPDSWVTVFLDAGLPSPDGPETQSAQSSTVKLEPTFFAIHPVCPSGCDPSDSFHDNAIRFTRPTPLTAATRALTIADMTDPGREFQVSPSGPPDPDVSSSTEDLPPQRAGFDRQPPARTWRFHLRADLQADDGQTLGYPWVGFVENAHARADVGFEGTVWEAGGGPVLPLIARNVTSISRSVSTVAPADLMPRLLALRQERRERSSGAQLTGDEQRLDQTPDAIEAHTLDVRRLLSSRGKGLLWASVAVRGMLPGAARHPYPYSGLLRNTPIQVTNLGISVKDSPISTLVFVTELDTGGPVSGARVTIIDISNKIQWSGSTGSDGIALAPPLNLRARDHDGLSFVVTAEKDDDVAYVESAWAGEHISRSDITYDRLERSLLRGSVFTDRGVYKKTEEVHVKAVVREDSLKGMRLLPEGSELDVAVSDSRGREIEKRRIRVNEWSSADWTWRVPEEAALGHYRIEILRPGQDRYQTWSITGGFQVAAFRRPDFRVDATLSADPPILGSTVRARVEAKYLFGGALGTRNVQWSARRERVGGGTDAIRERYSEVRYAVGYWPRWDPEEDREPLMWNRKEMLGADGRSTIELPTPEGDRAYSYTLEADVEDVSGQHIANRASMVMHSSSIYVAMVRPPMFVDAPTGTTTGVTVVDLAGSPVQDVPVTVSLLRVEWVREARRDHRPPSWEQREVPAGEWSVRSASREVPVQIPLARGGCYLLRAVARDSAGRQTRTELSFWAAGGGIPSTRYEGNHIDLTPERKSWKPGEHARILIQSPWERATALLTVEREGIRRHRTFTLTSTHEIVEVPIAEGDIPNVYVSVMLVKGRSSGSVGVEDTERPSYRIGYTQLTVEDETKRLRVNVSADRETYRPRQSMTVNVGVSSRDGKPVQGEVTLWAVDYGLLSLTKYTTPDVVKAIHQPKPLQVMTQDNRRTLMRRRALRGSPGAPTGGLPGELMELVELRSSAAISGMPFFEGANSQGDSEMRSDFRPLVFWIGSTTTDARGRAETTVTLPDSLTTYRIIAVAGDTESRFGSGERDIRVTKTLTLLPAFPRFLNKGDRASFGAVVTNSSGLAGDAVVTIQSLNDELLQFETVARKTVSLAAGASARVPFDAIARASGTPRVRITATLGPDTDAFEMPLVVSESLRREITASYGDTLGTATEKLTLDPGALPRAGSFTVDLASTALVGLSEGARYLNDYPYECGEQKASRAVALMLAADLGGAFNLSRVDAQDYRLQATRVLDALHDHQCQGGGFALWAGRCGSESAYLTAYVLDIFNRARALRYEIDQSVVSNALQYLESTLKQKPPEMQWWPAWSASQAYSVKVLAEYGRKPGDHIRSLVTISERLPIFALSYVADALATSNDRGSAYQEIVNRLRNAIRMNADRAHVEEIDDDALGWVWNTNVSATAVVLEGLSRRKDEVTLAPQLARWLIAEQKNGRWMTTHENATALAAFVSYYRTFEQDVPQMTATVALGSERIGSAAFQGRSTSSQRVEVSIPELLKRVTSTSPSTLTIAKNGTGRLYYTARLERLVPDRRDPIDRGFRIVRRYERYATTASAPPETSFHVGDLVRVTVTVTLRGEGRYLALTDPLPAGLEPIDASFQTAAKHLEEESTDREESNWVSLWRRGTFDHVEKHDDRVVAFATRLGSGRHEFSYLVRATTPGTFHSAGARLEAMYAPELEGRSEAATLTIK